MNRAGGTFASTTGEFMLSNLFGQIGHSEPSTRAAFSYNHLIRQSENRPDDCLETALGTEGAHGFAIAPRGIILKHDGEVLDPLFAPYELAVLEPDFDNAALLGLERNGEPRLGVPVGIDTEHLPELYKFVDYRSLYMDDLVGAHLQGQVAQAASLVAWNVNCLFCGRCGQPTDNRAGGYKRVCTACQTSYFPRTDPVVIMHVIDPQTDRCLLGRSAHFREGMYSCLAGFVEPGETIEDAVRRETHEESGITIGRVAYHASQPWPMPHSLMIGCYGEALDRTINYDREELQDCRWFDRTELRAMLERMGDHAFSTPPAGAIAHLLMRDWVDRD